MARPPVQKHQVVELEIEGLAYGGAGLGKIDGYVVFVRDALPGDRVRARIGRRKASYAQASIETLLRPSPLRIDARCPLHETCGGCVWQNLPYEEQLKAKASHVAEALEHIGGQQAPGLEPIEPSPRIWRYRNKMEFSFGSAKSEVRRAKTENQEPGTENQEPVPAQTILGFHVPGRFDRIFPVRSCLIQPEAFDAALGATADWARQCGLAPYDPRSHQGILRSLMLRHSETTGAWLACLLTKTVDMSERSRVEELAKALERSAPGFAGLLWGFNDGLADVCRMDRKAATIRPGGEERSAKCEVRSAETENGEPDRLFLEEEIEGLRFRISPFSFFQTNTLGAGKLYATVREFAGLTGAEVLLDAYCGTGTIGLYCAPKAQRAGSGPVARRVFGVEIDRQAVWDARSNARRNGLEHCVFLCAPLARGVELVQGAAGTRIDRVVIDPPRGGMDKRSLRRLVALRAPVFVYVSCNPATLSRDAATICKAGYRIERVRPIDMFPHTYHIETVIRFGLE
jgi:23S rRNA (uracil1939-C5)-methyltransferase